MTPLQEQCPRRALGVTHGTKLAAFEAIEDAIGGKETATALVPCDDACGATSDFDDLGVGHDVSFAGLTGAPDG